MTVPPGSLPRVLAACLSLAIAFALPGVRAADLPIYGDGLTAGWVDWSWNTTRNFANGSPVHGGAHSLSVRHDAAWAGLYLHADSAVGTSGYGSLRFWLHGGATGSQKLRIVVNGNASVPITATANTWQSISVPLSELGSPAAIADLYWQDTSGAAQPMFYLDDIGLVAAATPPPVAGPTLNIDATQDRHPISPDIYGMNHADEALAAELGLPVRRWGGNSATRYNWKANLHNTGSDWYFENIPDGPASADGSATDLFVEQDRRTGTRTLLTVPLIGWTPRADSPRNHPYACGFRVSRYGQQQSTDPWDTDCGNGVGAGGAHLVGNLTSDTSTAIDAGFVADWLAHLTGKYGTAATGGVAYYNLDNEPMLWNSTHRDVHPRATTYDEIRDRTWRFAQAVKTADPTARTLGPTVWGWCAYFYSALDGCGIGDDYRTHGDTPFIPWYLQQMRQYERQNGTRILDYLDVHYYPQAGGVALAPAGNASTQALRLRSTRSLWDAGYIDESWIGTAVRLLPRLREWRDAHYPDTRLAITEYHWGGLESINGALAQADVLGIFGREGLDLATLWSPPSVTDPGGFAFRLYLNYDGAGQGFGETTVRAASSDQDTVSVYAALRGGDGALTLMAINKSPGDVNATFRLSGFQPRNPAAVYRYGPARLDAIARLADQPVSNQGFGATLPGSSITLFVVPAATATHTVTFNSNGGSAVPSQTVAAGGTATAPPPPTRTGHVFAGWYGDAGLTTPFNFATPVTADLTLHAGWTLASHAVTASVIGGNGGVSPASQTVRHGDSATIILTPNAGYGLASLTDNGAPVTPPTSPYVIRSVTAAHDVVATFVAVPRISGFTPGSGLAGSRVTVKGANLGNATSVTFDGTAAPILANTATALFTRVPATAGSGPIRITTAGGTAISTGKFLVKPAITGFAPVAGPPGTRVALIGSGFIGATGVRFHATAATFGVNAATQITATAPPGAITGRLTVTTPAGSASSAASFISAPILASVSPTSLVRGAATAVTLVGGNLTGATIQFSQGTVGGLPSITSTRVVVAVTGTTPGRGVLTLTTPGGSASLPLAVR